MHRFILFSLILLVQTSWNQTPSTLGEKFVIQDDIATYDPVIFKERRATLLKKIKGQNAIITSDNASDFYYITGFHHTDAIALLSKNGPKKFVLFFDENTPYELLWNGPKLSHHEAMQKYMADTVVHLSYLKDYLKKNIESKEAFSISRDKSSYLSELLIDEKYKIEKDLKNIVDEMRVIKDTWEIDQLQKAISVTAQAHKRILETLRPGQHEYDVRAEIEYVYHKNNGSNAFPSITGSGNNACYLHYEKYDAPLKEGDLILVDIGAKHNGYCGDITRTYPINGRFSNRQKELYTIVFNALKAGTEKMTPQNYFFDGHNAATQQIVRGLYQLGLITDTTSIWQKLFYIHYRSSHYLGIDVHDVGYYGQTKSSQDLVNKTHKGRKLEPGMVLTIEPGIYLLDNRIEQLRQLFPYVPPKELDSFYEAVKPVYDLYTGIGIRLEDDILITEKGHKVLSAEAPVSLEDIEKAYNPKTTNQ